MKNKNIVFIGGVLIIIILVGIYVLNSKDINNNPSKEATSSSEEVTEEMKETPNEEGVEVEIWVTEEGFSQKQVEVEIGKTFGIMNRSEENITLVGDKLFKNGQILEKGQGLSFPITNILKREISEMTFWLEENTDEKIKLKIE